jgi:uncharacterized membrane protein
MRKYFKYLTAFLLFIFLLPAHNAFADTRSFSIDSLNIDATVNTSGDLAVSETYDYNFKGDFNGITRNINFKETSGVDNIEVSVLDGSNKVTFKNNDSKENGSYSIVTDGTYKKLTIYSKNSNKVVKFNIKYNLLGVATKYKDAGELNGRFYENSSNIDINNLFLKVNFPSGNVKDAKYWGIGPASGNSSKADDNTFLFKVSKLNAGEYFGCRILFPADYLQSAKKIVNEDAYDRIYNEQKNNAYTENNSNRSSNSNNNNINNSVNLPDTNELHYYNTKKDDSSALFAIIGVVLFIVVIIAYKAKERKEFEKELEQYRSAEPPFNSDYYDSIPSDLSPALVTYLINKSIEIKDIIATLMDLSVRNVLKYTKNTYTKKKHISKDTEEIDFVFTINIKALDGCSLQERHLIEWLSSYGDSDSISLKHIEEQTNNRETAREFKNLFDNWVSLIEEEASSKPFYTKIRNREVLTNTYHNEKLKWLAFKKFLVNSMSSASKDSLDFELWKRYLPYALALGLVDKVIDFAPNMISDDYLTSDPLFYNMHYLNFIYYDFFDNFEGQIRENTTDNSSNNSGGFGDGGGFTSGGDGGSFGGGDSGAF